MRVIPILTTLLIAVIILLIVGLAGGVGTVELTIWLAFTVLAVVVVARRRAPDKAATP